MNNLPKISSYGQYSSENYGLNTLCVDLGTIKLYYSYETIVAFYTIATGKIVSKNYWSTTTGKHLNWIDNGRKNERVDSETFDRMLQEALKNHIV